MTGTLNEVGFLCGHRGAGVGVGAPQVVGVVDCYCPKKNDLGFDLRGGSLVGREPVCIC